MAATASEEPDVICLGESMVTFRPTRPGGLADVPLFERGIGGAESNVACVLAAAGHRAKWVGRVGADGFGAYVVAAIAAYGVDVSGVRRDAARPTGVYFRTAGERAVGPVRMPDAGEVAYYRAGSAASAMSPETVPADSLGPARVLHLTGITAALSPGCLGLTRALTRRRAGRPVVSFDVNYREPLWRGAPEGPGVLLELARGCDIVFVGEDEAEAAWGLCGAAAVREALPEPEVLVVKRGAAGATAYVGDSAVSVAAPRVDVVAPVGAGDAFAAGFLSGTLRGLPVERRLRHGHLMAAAALTVPGDLAAPPPRALADRLVALGTPAWGRLHLGPGWTQQPLEGRTA
ncbi:sugar kinase [Streptomyces sp. UNOC14_S4]|uniref:sugar kinase n=1 Tax=Streptomyces sp. UNOC14_S4 TaxID=2872340 RepID=UPI001E32F1F0|nr:sugar kinase [Streptomyces sp. UNOC14_S4]MCC3771747.1 sugar kinase [Streptomyces sp. UNOC14_S4]